MYQQTIRDMKIKVNNTVSIFSNERVSISETNDCAVRATAIALNQTYSETHAQYKAAGRKDGKGVRTFLIEDVLRANLIGVNLDTTTEFLQNADWNKRKCPTITQVLKNPKFQVGTHIMYTKGHVFTIKNGEIYGNIDDNGRYRVHGYITTITGFHS